MKKGSEDIRSLAVRNVLAGKYSIPQVAEMTGYSMATIYRGPCKTPIFLWGEVFG